MVSKISFSTFELSELNTLARQLSAILSEVYSDQPTLTPALQAVKEALALGDSALATPRGEALTEAVQQADSRRDDSYMGLRDHIAAGMRRHSLPAYQEACTRLKKAFDLHGNALHRESYAKESALLASLFKELSGPGATADLATIQATEWLQELQTDETAFLALYAQRDDERAVTERTTDQEAKQRLRQALEMLVTIINGLHLGGLLPNSGAVIDRLNQRIERSTAQARDRGRSAQPSAPTDPDPAEVMQ